MSTLDLRVFSIVHGLASDPELDGFRVDPFERHEWDRFNKVIDESTDEIFRLVGDFEEQVLQTLELPDISDVRKSVLLDEKPSEGETWHFSNEKFLKYQGLLASFQQKLIGDPLLGERRLNEPSFLQELAEKVFAACGPLHVGHILANAEDSDKYSLDLEELLNIAISNLENVYLTAMITNGMQHVKTSIATRHLAEFKAALIDMARNGSWPMDVGRYLHTQIGEGAGWYYNMQTRSQACLANNATFDFMAIQAGCEYQQWRAVSGCCSVCSALDGLYWPVGHGAYPVRDTHPHCLCNLLAFFDIPKDARVCKKWDRKDAYALPWSKDEKKKIQSYLW